MERKNDLGLGGMKTDRRVMKEITRMTRKKDFGLGGMRTDRRG